MGIIAIFFEMSYGNPYNGEAMELSEFQEEEFSFLEHLKGTDEYQRMKALSKEIEQDEKLTSLAKERDALFLSANAEKEERKKHALLLEFKAKDDMLREDSKMKEYLSLYQKIRHLLVSLSDRLTKEIRL